MNTCKEWSARGLRALLLAAILSAAVTRFAAGQVPVVLVHGLKGNGAAWNLIRSDLITSFGAAIESPRTPTFYSEVALGLQAADLLANHFGGIDSAEAIVVGHSNGGLVSREISKTRSLRGIVTLGTPHSGAPIIPALPSVLGFSDGAVTAFNDLAFSLVYLIPACYGPYYYSEWCSALFFLNLSIDYVIVPALIYEVALEFLPTSALLTEDTPGSAYLTTLNGSANLASEAALVRNRHGLVVTTTNGYVGGFLRLLHPPGTANSMAGDVQNAGSLFWLASNQLWAAADQMFYDWIYYQIPLDWDLYYALLNIGSAGYDAAYYLLNHEYAWCLFVNYPSSCGPSDSFIPTASQTYPGALNTAFEALWAHTTQWQDGFVIVQVRNRVAAILNGP